MLMEDNSDFYYLSKTPHLKNLEREKPTPTPKSKEEKIRPSPIPLVSEKYAEQDFLKNVIEIFDTIY